jgi:hypothetical protein
MKKLLLALTTSLVLSSVLATPSFAQSKLDLTVYPAVIEHEIKPGTPTRFLLQFRNNSKTPINGLIKVADYVIADKIGTPILVEDGQMSLKYAAAKWLTPLNNEITIPGDDYVAVNVSVNPPQEIGACGHYAIVYIEPFEGTLSGEEKQKTKSESSIVNKIGALVNLKMVSKECKQSVSVLGFTVPQFLEYGPIKVNFDLFNKGDVHVMPTGVVTATNMMNVGVDSVSIKEQRIFPETAKAYEVSVGQKYMLGRYAIMLQGKYGDSGLPFTQTAYVWMFPWKIAVVIILAIIILIILGKKIYKDVAVKQATLEEEIAEERDEIKKLKSELKKRD